MTGAENATERVQSPLVRLIFFGFPSSSFNMSTSEPLWRDSKPCEIGFGSSEVKINKWWSRKFVFKNSSALNLSDSSLEKPLLHQLSTVNS